MVNQNGLCWSPAPLKRLSFQKGARDIISHPPASMNENCCSHFFVSDIYFTILSFIHKHELSTYFIRLIGMRGLKPGTVASCDIYCVKCIDFKSPGTDLFDPEDPGFGLKVQVAVLVELIPAE